MWRLRRLLPLRQQIELRCVVHHGGKHQPRETHVLHAFVLMQPEQLLAEIFSWLPTLLQQLHETRYDAIKTNTHQRQVVEVHRAHDGAVEVDDFVANGRHFVQHRVRHTPPLSLRGLAGICAQRSAHLLQVAQSFSHGNASCREEHPIQPKKRCAWLCSTRCFASINVVHRLRVELGKPRGSRWQSGVLQRFLTLTAVVVGAVLVCHASTKTLGTLLKLVVDVISPEQPACQREIDPLVRGLRCTTLHVVCKRRHTLSVPFTKITSGEIVVVEMGDPFIPTILVNQLVHASLQEVCLGLGSWWRWHFVSFAGWLSVALLR